MATNPYVLIMNPSAYQLLCCHRERQQRCLVNIQKKKMQGQTNFRIEVLRQITIKKGYLYLLSVPEKNPKIGVSARKPAMSNTSRFLLLPTDYVTKSDSYGTNVITCSH